MNLGITNNFAPMNAKNIGFGGIKSKIPFKDLFKINTNAQNLPVKDAEGCYISLKGTAEGVAETVKKQIQDFSKNEIYKGLSPKEQAQIQVNYARAVHFKTKAGK